MIIIGVLVIIIVGAMVGEIEFFFPLALLIGLFALQRHFNKQIADLQQQVKILTQKLDTSDEAISRSKVNTTPVTDEQPATANVAAQQAPTDEEDLVIELDIPELDEPRKPAIARTQPRVSSESEYQSADFPEQADWPKSRIEQAMDKASQLIISYFTDGNIFVRVGLLVLFFGVAFLLKYAAQNSHIPIELRFLGAAMGGLGLVGVGWYLRNRKEIFALLLQGGGIGIIYITIFASYRIAQLIPSNLTFVLLVAFALITAALAVLQNSRSLAMYAVLGGFLAPFLASSGSGNYVGLFSYYAVLNLIVFAIAWFKAWRLLNLMGFVFTFGVYTAWFIFSYRSGMLWSAAGFLLLFFVMYSVLGVLYALKQSQNLKGLVDGTLVFGTPLVSSSLAMAMMRELEYGIAITSVAVGIYYIVLARFLWSRIGEQTRLLAESMLAIGVVFATLAIPYALDGHWSSAAWALEAAGILWVSLRQQRYYAQLFAIVLQMAAGILFLYRNANDLGDMAFMNPAFLGGVFIALGSFISARLLYQLERNNQLHQAHWLFYGWAMGWWLVSSLIQIDHYLSNQIFAVLCLLIATASILLYLDRIRQWDWLPATISQGLLLPALYLVALYSAVENVYYLSFPNIILWCAALALNYFIIFKLEPLQWTQRYCLVLYSAWTFLLVCMLSLDLYGRFYDLMPAAGDAWSALLAIFPLLTIWWVRQARMPVLQRFGVPLQLSITALMAGYMLLWIVFNDINNNGSALPLPFIPLLNPLDLAHLVFFIAVMRSLKLVDGEPEYRKWILTALGGLVFIWINALFLRIVHHYMGIPFNLERMLLNDTVQTGLSILWTLIGMLTIVYASRKSKRNLWISGAVLVAVVLLKLIFADLRASGTIERIVSFLVVGGLLVAMGYFSPIPPSKSEVRDEDDNDKQNPQTEAAGNRHE
jgi:uncharacterized membrane protein